MSQSGHKTMQEIAAASRYPIDAFHFVKSGLDHTVRTLHPNHEQLSDAERHVSGQQLSLGLRDFALEQYGHMARMVLGRWRINRTSDFGAIVFAMVDGGMMQATEKDSVRDFEAVFDFDEGFDTSIPLDRVPHEGFEPDAVEKPA